MNLLFSPGYYINMTAAYIKLFSTGMLKKAGLGEITLEQYGILYMLSKENGLYQRQICKALMKDRPNITRMIDILEKKNFLYREKSEKNKRISKLFITDTGMEFVKKVEPVKKNILAQLSSGISVDEMDSLLVTLEKIRKNVENNVQLQI